MSEKSTQCALCDEIAISIVNDGWQNWINSTHDDRLLTFGAMFNNLLYNTVSVQARAHLM